MFHIISAKWGRNSFFVQIYMFAHVFIHEYVYLRVYVYVLSTLYLGKVRQMLRNVKLCYFKQPPDGSRYEIASVYLSRSLSLSL